MADGVGTPAMGSTRLTGDTTGGGIYRVGGTWLTRGHGRQRHAAHRRVLPIPGLLGGLWQSGAALPPPPGGWTRRLRHPRPRLRAALKRARRSPARPEPPAPRHGAARGAGPAVPAAARAAAGSARPLAAPLRAALPALRGGAAR